MGDDECSDKSTPSNPAPPPTAKLPLPPPPPPAKLPPPSFPAKLPPPPPPPPIPQETSTKLSPAGLRGITNNTQLTVDPSVALIDAIERMLKFEPEAKDQDWLVYNQHTNPCLQEGPQCGLVALTQALNILLKPQVLSVDQVQTRAKQLGFTKQGEMFSVDNMSLLARDMGLETSVSPITPLSQTPWLISHLTSDHLLLVPYDCGHSHAPCLAEGRKAHWALITGLMVQCPTPDLNKEPISPDLPTFHHMTSFHPNPLGDCRVLARQSKSLVLGVWGIQQLVNSCCNLKKIGGERDEELYQIPDGGIESGLCGRMVILNKNRSC